MRVCFSRENMFTGCPNLHFLWKMVLLLIGRFTPLCRFLCFFSTWNRGIERYVSCGVSYSHIRPILSPSIKTTTTIYKKGWFPQETHHTFCSISCGECLSFCNSNTKKNIEDKMSFLFVFVPKWWWFSIYPEVCFVTQ